MEIKSFSWTAILILFAIAAAAYVAVNSFTAYNTYDRNGAQTGTSKPKAQVPGTGAVTPTARKAA